MTDDDMSNSSQYTWALAYARLGWKLVPVHSMKNGVCTCPKGKDCDKPGKHPRIKDWVNRASSDLDEVRHWWTDWPDANIAVACGAGSKILVIDVDPRNHGDKSLDEFEANRPSGPLPPTLKSRTGGGGWHLFFRYPTSVKVPKGNGWLPGVDIESDGGYVILPASMHASGGVYSWDNWDGRGRTVLADLPPDLVENIVSSPSGRSNRPGGQRGSGEDSSARTLSRDEIMAGLPEGERNDSFFRYACAWTRRNQHHAELHGGLKEQLREDLYDAAAACSPPFDRREVDAIIESAYRQDRSDTDVYIPTISFMPRGRINTDARYELNEEGNARRMLDMFGEQLRVARKGTQLVWYVYDNGRWTVDALGRAQYAYMLMRHAMADEVQARGGDPDMLRWREVCGSVKYQNNTLKYLASFPEVTFEPGDLDVSVRWLNLINGTLDLLNLSSGLLKHDPSHMCSKMIGTRFAPAATAPEWDAYLEKVLPDPEVRRYLQTVVGYALAGNPVAKVLILLLGERDTGKTVLLNVLTALFGGASIQLGDDGSYAIVPKENGYGVTGTDSLLLASKVRSSHQEDFHVLAGARLVVTSETPKGERLDEHFVKKYTGRDRFRTRAAYGVSSEWTPQGVIFNASNHHLKFNSLDGGTTFRVRVIEFLQKFYRPDDPNADTEFIRDEELEYRIITNELSGVLNWALDGYRRYRDERLKEPEAVLRASAAYVLDQDDTTRFIQDAVAEGKIFHDPDGKLGNIIVPGKIHKMYKSWCAVQNVKPMGLQSLSDVLEKTHGWKRHTSGNRGFIGWYVTPGKTFADLEGWGGSTVYD